MVLPSDLSSSMERLLAPAFGRPHDPQAGPIFVRGEGCWLWDTLGHKILDFRSGYSATNFGHAHPRLVARASQQLATLHHLTQLPSLSLLEFAEHLLRCVGVADDQVLFNTSGSRCVESALKIAWLRKPGSICRFSYSYHGRSLATGSLSDTRSSHSSSLQVETIDFPYPTGRSLAPSPASWQGVLEIAERTWSRQSHKISAVIVEPALGARGYLAPPAVFFQRLRELATRYDILLVDDEIQMGLGRCGDWLLSTSQGWRGDLTLLGKSLSGGMIPMSAVIGSKELMRLLPNGLESETFAGSPLGAAIGDESLKILVEEKLLERARDIGVRLQVSLRALVQKHRLPAAVDGIGASAVLEWYGEKWLPDRMPHELAAASASQIARKCLDHGLLLHPSGPGGNRLVLIPPLIASDSELDEGILRLEKAVMSFLQRETGPIAGV